MLYEAIYYLALMHFFYKFSLKLTQKRCRSSVNKISKKTSTWCDRTKYLFFRYDSINSRGINRKISQCTQSVYAFIINYIENVFKDKTEDK